MQKDRNKMGTMPMPGLILNMSLPLMFSLLIQTLYNIVDSIFVARLGQNALTAVSLAYPMQILMIAVSVGTALRQVVLLVPLVWLLARTLGIGQAWYAFWIAEPAAALYSGRAALRLLKARGICAPDEPKK